MIITRLEGGLGNQMFQYAFAKSLSKTNDCPLRLHLADKTLSIHNGYELEKVFNVNAQIATASELKTLLGWQSNESIVRLTRKPVFSFLKSKNIVIERSFEFNSEYMNTSCDAYLIGYWQSEKYFKNNDDLIKNEFMFKAPLSAENQLIAQLILSSNSVSLHIRRGDFVSNPKISSIHGVCNIEYYKKAINYVSSKINDPVFFVFSDDINWVKNNLEINFKHHFITNNIKQDSYNDMRLMSLCKHNIIANSSFSWWGAWLNSNPQKFIIAPVNWFAENRKETDLIPATWIRV